jgi:hypothetical protein
MELSLKEQLERYARKADMAFIDLAYYLMQPEFRLKLIQMGRRRLEDGYLLYGSEMYNWDRQTRTRNCHEELADWSVYDSSGEHD